MQMKLAIACELFGKPKLSLSGVVRVSVARVLHAVPHIKFDIFLLVYNLCINTLKSFDTVAGVAVWARALQTHTQRVENYIMAFVAQQYHWLSAAHTVLFKQII